STDFPGQQTQQMSSPHADESFTIGYGTTLIQSFAICPFIHKNGCRTPIQQGENRTVQIYAHRHKYQYPIPSFYSPLCKVSCRLLHLAAQFTKADRPSTFFHDGSFIGQVLCLLQKQRNDVKCSFHTA